jgi:hypothetical protein
MNGITKGPLGGFMGMVFTFLGIVLWVTLFGSIMTMFDNLLGYAHLSSFTLLSTLYQIGPVIIFLGMLAALGWGYYKGYMSSSKGEGLNFLMWIVFGALQIILFLSLFPTVVTSLYTVLSDSSISNYIALGTVIQISAAIIFLGGLFAGGWNIAQGVKQVRKSNKNKAQREQQV